MNSPKPKARKTHLHIHPRLVLYFDLKTKGDNQSCQDGTRAYQVKYLDKPEITFISSTYNAYKAAEDSAKASPKSGRPLEAAVSAPAISWSDFETSTTPMTLAPTATRRPMLNFSTPNRTPHPRVKNPLMEERMVVLETEV